MSKFILRFTLLITVLLFGSKPFANNFTIGRDESDIVYTRSTPAVITAHIVSVSTDFFRSANASGDWSNPADWQSSVSTGGPWVAATLSPDENAQGIFIQSGHTMSISSGIVTADDITINTGGTLILGNGSLDLLDGAASVDMQVDGTFTQNGTGTFLQSSALVAFGVASVYNHNRAGGVIPAATWHFDSPASSNNAACIVNSNAITSVFPAGINQQFSDFTWNCANQNTRFDNTGASFGTLGSLNIISTGTAAFNIHRSGTSHSYYFGSINVSGGMLEFNYEDAPLISGVSLINVDGNVSVTGTGIIDFGVGTSAPQYGVYRSILLVGGDLAAATGTEFRCTDVANLHYGITVFSKKGTQYLTMSPASSPLGIDFAITPDSKVTLNAPLYLADDQFTSCGTIDFGNASNTIGTLVSGIPFYGLFELAGNTSVAAVPAMTGTVTNGSNIITPVSANPSVNLFEGMAVTGTNIPPDTYVVGFTSSAPYKIFLSKNVTGTASGVSLSFTSKGNLITAHANGLNPFLGALGSIQTLYYYISSNANYEFKGALTGMLFTSPSVYTVNNLTVSGSSGTVSMNGDIIVNRIADLNTGTLAINGRTLTLRGTVTGSGTLSGSSASNLVIGGTTGGDLGTLNFKPGFELLNNFTMNRTGAGAQVNFGTNLTVGGIAAMTNGAVIINATTLALNGTLTGTGTFTGSSASNLSVGGTAGGTLGTLNFTTGNQLLSRLNLNRTGVGQNPAVILGTSLTVKNLDLSNGIAATGSNLLTFDNTGLLTLPAASNNSYVCTCDASGNNITATGSNGFRINNVSGSTDQMFPVGANFKSANRMAVNMNGSTADDFTVVVTNENIGDVSLPVVHRIWYVNESTPGGSMATMKLYFTKKAWAVDPFGSANNNEVQDGFLYDDAHLVQKTAISQFVNNSLSPSADININYSNTGLYPFDSEIYAQYSKGVSVDLFGGFNGITGFTRFAVVNADGIILPVTVVDIKAYRQNNAVNIEWAALNEINIDHYEAERSANGVLFTAVARIAARNNGSTKNNYTLTDYQPLPGNNFYRIKIFNRDGSIKYTNVVVVNLGSGNAFISIMPNPVQNKLMTLRLSNIAPGKYTVLVHNTIGHQVYQKTLEYSGGAALQNISLPSYIKTGTYMVSIFNDKNKYSVKAVVL